MRFRLPSRRVSRVVLFLLAFLALSAWLAWVLLEPVRLFVAIPLEFLAWLIKTLYLLVPRYLWWVIFLVVAYVIAFGGLMGRATDYHWYGSPSAEYSAEPKVTRLARYVRMRRNPFYHHRLNHLVTEVALRALAYREQAPLHQTRLALSRHALDLPPEIEKFLISGLPPWPDLTFPPPTLLERLFSTRHKVDAGQIEAEQVLDYLEEILEVPRDDRDSSGC